MFGMYIVMSRFDTALRNHHGYKNGLLSGLHLHYHDRWAGGVCSLVLTNGALTNIGILICKWKTVRHSFSISSPTTVLNFLLRFFYSIGL